MNGTDVITASLLLLGVLDPGETIPTSDGTTCLAALNTLLESWGTERLNVFQIVRNAYNLTTTVGAYTIGAAGTFNAARPVKIEEANILMPSGGATGNNRVALKLITSKEYAAIRSLHASGSTPQVLYNDHAYPLSTLTLWPVPTFSAATRQLELLTWQILSQFPDLTTATNFPPGYLRALQYNLALEIAPTYAVQPSQLVVQIAAESKAAIRSVNASPAGGDLQAVPLNSLPPSGS